MSNGKDICMSPGAGLSCYSCLFLTHCVISSSTIDLELVVFPSPGCTLESPGRYLKVTKPHPQGFSLNWSHHVWNASQVIPAHSQSGKHWVTVSLSANPKMRIRLITKILPNGKFFFFKSLFKIASWPVAQPQVFCDKTLVSFTLLSYPLLTLTRPVCSSFYSGSPGMLGHSFRLCFKACSECLKQIFLFLWLSAHITQFDLEVSPAYKWKIFSPTGYIGKHLTNCNSI